VLAGDRGAQETVNTALASAWSALGKSGQSLLDQSFLSGLADTFDMIEHPDRATATRTLARLAHSMTPFAGAQRTVRDALDPMVRAPEGLTENIMANMAGLSQRVPAKLDRFGQAIQKPGGPLRRAADPFNVSPVSDDPVLAELGRLGVRMGFPSDRLAGLELSRDEGRTVQVTKGQTTYRVLEQLLASDGYQRLSDERKAQALERAIDLARSAGSQALRPTIKARLRARTLAEVAR
jgi:hypothetical protein